MTQKIKNNYPFNLASVFLVASFLFQNFLFSQSPNGLLPYRKGKFWGYADAETGKIVVQPTLDSVDFFQFEYNNLPSPLAWVKKASRFGLVNRAGVVVLPIEEVVPFSVQDMGNGFYFMERFAFGATSEETEVEINPDEEFVNRKVFYFDKAGNPVGESIDFQNEFYRYTDGYGYSEDQNGFGIEWSNQYDNTLISIQKDKKHGLFDLKKNQMVIEPIYQNGIDHAGKLGLVTWGIEDTLDGETTSKQLILNLENGNVAEIPEEFEIKSIFQNEFNLLLAQNRATKLFGFLNRNGETVIPFQYVEAFAFSKNGKTKVQTTDKRWEIIDTLARAVIRLGKYRGFYEKEGEIWTQSDEDALFRKRDAPKEDAIGNYGFGYPPEKVVFENQTFWRGSRFSQTESFTLKNGQLTPFEIDRFDILNLNDCLPQDSLTYKKYISVSKKGRNWIFDRIAQKLIWPNIQYADGLILGETFEKSNFQIARPFVGDSLFVITLNNGLSDVLNVKSGVRWHFEGKSGAKFCQQNINNDWCVCFREPYEVFDFKGQKVEITLNYHPVFGKWSSKYDSKTGLTTVFDTVGLPLCQIRIPFKTAGNTLQLMENKGGSLMKFVLVASSEKRESAVFSLDGRLLSPKYIWNATVENDLIFAKMYQKMGVFSLKLGKQIIPFSYKFVFWTNNVISATDWEDAVIFFNLNGEVIDRYPKGFRAREPFSDGLQLMYHTNEDCISKFIFVDNSRKIVIPADGKTSALSFSEGLAAVKYGDMGWKFIDVSGKQAIPGTFKAADSFKNGCAIVQKNDSLWQVIDKNGMDRFAAKGIYFPVKYRFGSDYFVLENKGFTNIYSSNGDLVLENCTLFRNYAGENVNALVFVRDHNFGLFTRDGQVISISKSDFTTDFYRSRDKISVIKYYEKAGCRLEGLFNSATQQWLIEPAFYQSILPADYDWPFVFLAENNEQKRKIINIFTGEVVSVEAGDIGQIENLGWHVDNDETQKAFLYSPDFTQKRVLKYGSSIVWNEELSVFSVVDWEGSYVDFISPNGHFLFED